VEDDALEQVAETFVGVSYARSSPEPPQDNLERRMMDDDNVA
jgi:hypothetical protein